MARPVGMTIKAGPGNTSIASPRISTVKPMTAMISLLACLTVLRINPNILTRAQSFPPQWLKAMRATDTTAAERPK